MGAMAATAARTAMPGLAGASYICTFAFPVDMMTAKPPRSPLGGERFGRSVHHSKSRGRR